jgi:hypothetical protein
MAPAGEMWSVVTESPKIAEGTGARDVGDRGRAHRRSS